MQQRELSIEQMHYLKTELCLDMSDNKSAYNLQDILDMLPNYNMMKSPSSNVFIDMYSIDVRMDKEHAIFHETSNNILGLAFKALCWYLSFKNKENNEFREEIC